ncbi:MAG: IS3 family transposase [Mycoplasma sp.]|nr:IS3 family transposase [Mycoplasma sp.]
MNKAATEVKSPTKVKIKYVNDLRHFFPIKMLLKFVGLPASTWGKYKNFDYNKKDLQEQKCIDAIYKVFVENRKQIGAKRISQKLKQKNIIINHKKVARIMREQGIRALYVRKMMKKSARTKAMKLIAKTHYPDLIGMKFKQFTSRFEALYLDITYLIFKKQKQYKITIIDAYTREILGYKITKTMATKNVILVLKSVLNLIKKHNHSTKNIILHSDHGVQFRSRTYKKFCTRNGLLISMGAKYTVYDNIIIESVFSLFKKGTIHNNNYKSIDEYVLDAKRWVKWYNQQIYEKFKIESYN